jgi:tetratricopeptide (TPR) repeat protein
MGWFFAAALIVAVFLAYQPAWHGGLIWDDNEHVTKPELQSVQGLYEIWFHKGVTLQYYPILHSAFWLEHKLWGDATLGYHLTNIALHCLAAMLVLLALRRLKISGAFLAAAIFALHPVQVESVAWIAEQKNTLSAVFYLSALLVYLQFDQTRRVRWYLGALALFVLAVLSKTVTATLPGGLLVIFWWQRGRLSWKKDVLPLVPFFALGAGGGIITALWELQFNNCTGPEFAFTFVDRILIAGRAACFCMGKLFWPTHLLFLYPRWQIDSGAWWQYLFPLSMSALLAAFCAIRRRTRAPLAALLYFGGTLFPVLGFFNLYTFRYSLVANHYQYLASLGLIAIVSAGAAWLLERWALWRRPGGYALCLGLLAILAGLTFRHSQMYANVETLYATTIAANPDCWLAHGNLGQIFDAQGNFAAAMAEYRKTLDIYPDCLEARNNLAQGLVRLGKLDEAVIEYRKAVKLHAMPAQTATIYNNLGVALESRGRAEEAIAAYRKAVETVPDDPVAHTRLGNVLLYRGRLDEALPEFLAALNLKPDDVQAYKNLGIVLGGSGRFDEAILVFQKALEIQPDFAEARQKINMALSEREGVLLALAQQRESLRAHPNDIARLNDLAWHLATNPNASVRNGTEAVNFAQRAVKLSGGGEPAILGTLAAAYAEVGRFSEAAKTARNALDLATRQNKKALAESVKTKITLYESRTPFRETRNPFRPKQP